MKRNKKSLYGFILCALLIIVYIGYIKPINDARKIVKDESQYYLIHYGTEPNQIINGFFERNPSFPDSSLVEETLHAHDVDTYRPLYYFNIGNMPNGSIHTSLTLHQENQDHTLYFNAKDLPTYVFSCQEESVFPATKSSVLFYPKENEAGIYLSYQAAKTLNILDDYQNTSITLSLYIPVAVSTATNTLYPKIYEVANLTYVKKEITVPILGVINEKYPHIDSCFGYMNYAYMNAIWYEVTNDYTLSANETYWTSNTYQIYTDEENMQKIEKELTDFDSRIDMIQP